MDLPSCTRNLILGPFSSEHTHKLSTCLFTGSTHQFKGERQIVPKYCTAILNSALGVAYDLSAELYLPAELPVSTCDQPKISADSIFGGVLLPHREEIFIISHFMTLRPPVDGNVML
jgi:hypothetical protein